MSILSTIFFKIGNFQQKSSDLYGYIEQKAEKPHRFFKPEGFSGREIYFSEYLRNRRISATFRVHTSVLFVIFFWGTVHATGFRYSDFWKLSNCRVFGSQIRGTVQLSGFRFSNSGNCPRNGVSVLRFLETVQVSGFGSQIRELSTQRVYGSQIWERSTHRHCPGNPIMHTAHTAQAFRLL